MAPVLKCLLLCLCTLQVAVDARVRGMMMDDGGARGPVQTRKGACPVLVLSGGGEFVDGRFVAGGDGNGEI